MERPYVICHMLSSLDGKIDGRYMSMPKNLPDQERYPREDYIADSDTENYIISFLSAEI